MKTIYGIDEQGFMTYETIEISREDDVPAGYVDIPLPTDKKGNQLPFWKPKWTGEEWVEARPKEDILEEQNKPNLTPTELMFNELAEINAHLWHSMVLKDVDISTVKQKLVSTDQVQAAQMYDALKKDILIKDLKKAQSISDELLAVSMYESMMKDIMISQVEMMQSDLTYNLMMKGVL